MVKKAAIGISIIMALALVPKTSASSANVAGGSCSVVGKTARIGASKYICKLNTKTKKNVWTKLVPPAGFSCSDAKSSYSTAEDMIAEVQSNLELLKSIASPNDKNLQDLQAQYEQAQKDLKTLKAAITNYC